MYGLPLLLGFCLCTILLPTNTTAVSLKLIPIITKATVQGHDNYARTNVTILRYGSIQNYTIDLAIEVLTKLDNLKMNIGYFIRMRNSENWIYNKTFNFCAFLSRPSIDRFGSMVYYEMRRHGKIPPKCPLFPEFLLFKNLTFNQLKIPSFLPETSFGLKVSCYLAQTNEFVFQSNWYGRLRKIMM
ncbi:uncharacterized protein LOC128726025 [Anopheles nili]|uniref:uncharacterized protein LOC128726025 n=1 Tax=Anopheles nili TaxID=185578 RepID=UPI00237A447F|nr:uncharacterized protein LOC128726025 [Anopheles nili]